jgi:hypothetical protein
MPPIGTKAKYPSQPLLGRYEVKSGHGAEPAQTPQMTQSGGQASWSPALRQALSVSPDLMLVSHGVRQARQFERAG